jgi:hypothetical protein
VQVADSYAAFCVLTAVVLVRCLHARGQARARQGAEYIREQHTCNYVLVSMILCRFTFNGRLCPELVLETLIQNSLVSLFLGRFALATVCRTVNDELAMKHCTEPEHCPDSLCCTGHHRNGGPQCAARVSVGFRWLPLQLIPCRCWYLSRWRCVVRYACESL